MADAIVAAYAPGRTIAVVKCHTSNPDKGKRARKLKRILLAYPKLLVTLGVTNRDLIFLIQGAACNACIREPEKHIQVMVLKDFDAREATAGTNIHRNSKCDDDEVWDSTLKEQRFREVADYFLAPFLLNYPEKGIRGVDKRGEVA
ncbi:hypothetical protein V491_02898 [Pseudogymnoascus sp. VKM F-3775]|nr:hypothetical protein V491_02898 [Pseudogymnoascus sp. VKM F-3775]